MSLTKIIKLGDQDWKVTPFHCVVGPITSTHFFREMADVFKQQVGGFGRLDRPDPFDYVVGRAEKVVAKYRAEYKGRWVLWYTGDPLFANELQLEEITLACVDNGKLVVVNFADLPGVKDAAKIYLPGELWLNYAEGGAEKALREGRARGGTPR